jgi:hypothetical protein
MLGVAIAGEAGVEPLRVGGLGAAESSTYVIDVVEHGETFPAASVADAQIVVLELLATVMPRPGEANAAAVPAPTTVDVHVEFVNKSTVDPASAVPMIVGLLLLEGELGLVPVTAGAAGAVVSTVNSSPPGFVFVAGPATPVELVASR